MIIFLTICYFLFSKYFQANRDQHSIVANVINPPIIARFCRIIPRGWYRHISMRVEFYGCKAGTCCKLPQSVLPLTKNSQPYFGYHRPQLISHLARHQLVSHLWQLHTYSMLDPQQKSHCLIQRIPEAVVPYKVSVSQCLLLEKKSLWRSRVNFGYHGN